MLACVQTFPLRERGCLYTGYAMSMSMFENLSIGKKQVSVVLINGCLY